MKKFSKLLLLLLALIAIVTAFTVVALAEEELTPVLADEILFELQADGTEYEKGDVFLNNSKKGQWDIDEADNGNKYVVASYNGAETGNAQNWDRYITGTKDASGSKIYPVTKYPNFALDFDVMSRTGGFPSTATVRPDFYSKETTRSQVGTSFKLSDISLPKVAGQWNHVTMVVNIAENGQVACVFYVNGTETYSKSLDYSSTLTSSLYDTLRVGVICSVGVTGSTSYKICYDNFRYTYYPASYGSVEDGFDKIVSYHYNDSYEMPYGTTVAKIGETVYDDVNKAISAAAEGATVKLMANVTNVIIDKRVILDTNVYDENGNATGTFYTYTYKSSKAYEPTETAPGSGIYSFDVNANAVEVIWDEKCSESCDCYAQYGGHRLTASTNVLLGDTPEYFGETPLFDMAADYTHKKFLGWSYENDGTVDEFRAITEADLASGAPIKLYPVYTTIQYKIELTTASGTSTYHTEDKFASLFNKTGSKIKLLADIYTECNTIVISHDGITLDLNGYDLKRCFVFGNVYEVISDGNGGYDFENPTLTSEVAFGNEAFFKMGTSYINFTITSNTGSSSLYSVGMQADTWYSDGVMVKRTATGITHGHRLLHSNEKNGTHLTLSGGISVHIYQLFYQTYASVKECAIDLDGIYFYWLDADILPSGTLKNYKYNPPYSAVITMLNDYANTINIVNSTLCFPYNEDDVYFMNFRTAYYNTDKDGDGKNDTTLPRYYTEAQKLTVNFKNSDIIRPNISTNPISPDGYGWSLNIRINDATYDASLNGTDDDTTKATNYAEYVNVIYDNCRVFDVLGNNNASLNRVHQMKNGTLYLDGSGQYQHPSIADGYESVEVRIPYTYNTVTTRKFTLDTSSDVNAMNFDLGSANVTYNFNKIVTKPVNVNWVVDGETVKTEQFRPGVDALTEPKIIAELLEDNPYLNRGYFWLDAEEDGNDLPEILGLRSGVISWQDEYSFYGFEEINGEQRYIGGLKNAMFNMSYYTSFRYNFYLPVDAALTINSVSLESGKTVLIDNEQYYTYVGVWSTTNASELTDIVVKFTLDGVSYTQTFSVNALLYANMVLTDDVLPATAEEKAAIGNMVRFIKEARVYVGKDVSETFDQLITLSEIADYSESYAGETDIDTLSDYISYVTYVIKDGVASYKFGLRSAEHAELIKLSIGAAELEFTVGTDEVIVGTDEETGDNITETQTYIIVNNAKVYDIIKTITISIDETNLSANYSILSYIEENPEISIAKALYEFGLATENYIASLS